MPVFSLKPQTKGGHTIKQIKELDLRSKKQYEIFSQASLFVS